MNTTATKRWLLGTAVGALATGGMILGAGMSTACDEEKPTPPTTNQPAPPRADPQWFAPPPAPPAPQAPPQAPQAPPTPQTPPGNPPVTNPPPELRNIDPMVYLPNEWYVPDFRLPTLPWFLP